MRVGNAGASGAAAFACIVGAFLAAGLLSNLNWAWALSAMLLVGFCASVGIAISGRPAGVIIDNRNRVSLSKFQAAAWTVMVLSGLLAMVIARIRYGITDPVNVGIPGDLLAAMGISATSLFAAPVVLSLKSDQTPPPNQVADTAAKLGDDSTIDLATTGKVYARNAPSKAQWLDMFRGEEVSNAASPDLSKIQQFLVTVVVIVVYGVALWSLFTQADKSASRASVNLTLGSLPAFSPQMAWLIGISHAAYLAYKAAPHGSSDGGNGQPQAARL